jgi:uncharacterized protein GlcG (DUF336 family)
MGGRATAYGRPRAILVRRRVDRQIMGDHSVDKTASVWVAACVLVSLASASFGQATGAGGAGPSSAAAPGAAAGSAPPPAARGPSLKLALEAAQKALDTCKGLDQKIGVTVVDSAGVLKVVLATDGASTRGVASSTNKALTALAFTSATSELGEKIKTDTALAEKVAANANYNSRAGGVLLKVGADVIGAIGVGGAKGSEKDEACAIAGLQKIKGRLR